MLEGDEKPCHVAEAAASSLYKRIVQQHFTCDLSERVRGVELWAQHKTDGTGLAFHFDKDESLFAHNGTMLQPSLSSVLYLSNADNRTSGPRLSPTVITEQSFDSSIGEVLPSQPHSTTIVFPRRNTFVAFDGSFSHGVLEGPALDRRTLLINFWTDHVPHELERLPSQSHPPFPSSHGALSCSPTKQSKPHINITPSSEVIDVADRLNRSGVLVVSGDEASVSDSVHVGHPQMALVQVDKGDDQNDDGLALALVPYTMLSE